MSVYDVKIENLTELPRLEGSAIVSDCCGTLFEHGSDVLFPDVEDALRNVGCLALVSAFPDDSLMSARKEILGAQIGINSDRPVWYKGALFTEAARQLAGLTEDIIILGDRSVADVGVAKFVLGHHGFNTLGVRVARPNLPVSIKVDHVLRPGFAVCAGIAKLAGQDERFRPRDDEGRRIAQSFIAG